MFFKYKKATPEKPRIFYIHTPKTGGTSVNSFFTALFKNSITHAESQSDRLTSEYLLKYQYVSGHLSYSKISPMLDKNWLKIITFREPYSQVISHLSWVRQLADEGQEKRLRSHPEIFQTIALKMKSLDFSKPDDINKLFEWLKSIKFNYFFNTQIIYLDTNKNLTSALCNLYEMEFVGLAEASDTFFKIMKAEFSTAKTEMVAPRDNINLNKYGLDINDCGTRLALVPFIEKDIVVYNEARHIFTQRLRNYGNTVVKS